MKAIKQSKGRLIIISAPSGAGKSSIRDKILIRLPDLIYSVSYTSRKAREGELDGVDYNFISKELFREMLSKGDFLEWSEHFGNYYGTSAKWVKDRLDKGFNVLADIDVVGATSLKKTFPEAVLVFLAPPTASELKRRLLKRGTESEEEIRQRLDRVKIEVKHKDIYDFLLINDDLDKAVDELKDIITTGSGQTMAASELFWTDFFKDKGPSV